MGRERKPNVTWDELYAFDSFQELFRYRKARRTRAYNLRPLSAKEAELWVVADSEGKSTSRKLVTFTHPKDAAPFLESVQQELRAGGWTQL